MSTTPDFGIPLVSTQQATPEVTHNEGLYLLQALLSGAISLTNTPPGAPTVGDVYICDTAPTGAWAGKANKIAIYTDGGWRFVPGVTSAGANIVMGARHEGIRIWRRDVAALWVWLGTAWVELTQTSGSV